MPTGHSINVSARLSEEAFVAADVGGTHVRMGLIEPDSTTAGRPDVLDYRKYRCADFPSLGEIMAEFLRDAGQGRMRVRRGVVASAGYALEDGSVIAGNLPWTLAPARIRDDLGFQSLHLVNDFEAVAYAAPQMAQSEVLHVCGPQRAVQQGPALVIGPGTGLGAAVWIPTSHGGSVVLATEAGQAALSTGTELEFALLRELMHGGQHVSIERLISGPGLLTLYRTLCKLAAATPLHATPAEVTAAAIAGTDSLAHETLSTFVGLLGSVVGDMALLYGIRGGIYLAGGFLPQIGQFIADSSFVARFSNKGGMRPALEKIPVKVIEHGQLGVIGAANWLLQHEARG